MKKIAFILTSVLLTPMVIANGGPVIYQSEKYRDEIKTKNSSYHRTEQTREKMESNPRNRAMVESFEHIGKRPERAKKPAYIK